MVFASWFFEIRFSGKHYKGSNRRDGRVAKSNKNNIDTGGSSLLPRHFWVYYCFSWHSMEGTRVPFLSSKNCMFLRQLCKTSALLEPTTETDYYCPGTSGFYCFSWHSMGGTLCELENLHLFKCSLVRDQFFWNWRWFSVFCCFFLSFLVERGNCFLCNFD